ncbi:MAG: N-acetyltransferase [Candidatus Azobacteroides sp.]|nr:N-acetyltransferase [Candidatus Azobacteroides sp.]
MNVTINQTNNSRNGIFKAKNEDGKIIGQMSYVWAGNDKIIIDHTEVSPAYEGRGVGKDMVYHAVDFARENHVKILPVCAFARAVFRKIPEINDVKFQG